MNTQPKLRGFRCPDCGTPLKVRRTLAAAREVVRRRRLCPACGYRLSTVERRAGSPFSPAGPAGTPAAPGAPAGPPAAP